MNPKVDKTLARLRKRAQDKWLTSEIIAGASLWIPWSLRG
jgi:hypothetical protein